MDLLNSENKEPDVAQVEKRVPLSGEKLVLAVEAMKKADFLVRLTARIMKLAKAKGFHSPFKDSMDLPGGKSAADLADDILEKVLDGTFTWDRAKTPDFYHFCLSRAESILSNSLERTRPYRTMSHVLEEDREMDALNANQLNTASAPDDIYDALRTKEGGALGDRFLEDFALSLPDGSVEQRIILAVFDDRECANRQNCYKKLKISEDIYDAAMKRILRRVTGFMHEWRAKNKIQDIDWKEAR